MCSHLKAHLVCLVVIPLCMMAVVGLWGVPASFSGNIYVFSSFTGLSLFLVGGLLTDSLFDNSVSLSYDYQVLGIFLFLSGMTPYLPFFNPVDVVPLLQFLWNLKS